MNLPSPAIVPQSAVRRLPRWALLLLCLAYILPGFLGRDPWRGADMTALGYMLELAQGHTPWLSPLLGDLPPETGLRRQPRAGYPHPLSPCTRRKKR